MLKQSLSPMIRRKVSKPSHQSMYIFYYKRGTKFAKEWDANEVSFLRRLSHPNIINILGYYYDARERTKYMLLEHLIDGDLFDWLNNQPYSIPNDHQVHIAKQGLSVLRYLEKNEIIHRDIKLENFLVRPMKCGCIHIILIDFQYTVFTNDLDSRICGTPAYIAPECYLGLYSYGSDMWAFGVMLYMIATRVHFPVIEYTGRNDTFKNTICSIARVLRQYNSDFTDFLYSIFRCSEVLRLTPKDASKHPWIIKKPHGIHNRVLDRLKTRARRDTI